MRSLPKNIKLLGWVSFLTDVSSEMIFPLLPVFLTTVLRAGPFALGLIEGISDSISSLMKLIAGYWSDRLQKRRFFVFLGYGLSSFLRPLIGLAPHWLFVLGLRFGDRVGKGIRTAPRDALIASSVQNRQRGGAFGFHRMMDHAGAVVGSLLGAFFITLAPQGFRLIFLSAAIPALASLFLLSRIQEVSYAPPHAASFQVALAPLAKIPLRVKGFLALLFFFTLGNATDAFLLLRLKEGGIATFFLPLLWAGLHIVKAIANSIFGRIADRVDRRLLILIGWLFYGGVYALFAFPLSLPFLISLFLLYGIFYGLTESPEKALLAEWVEFPHLGQVYGWYHTILGMALLPASLIFGFLWEKWDYETAFAFGAALSLISSMIWGVWFVFSRSTPPNLPNERA